MEFRIERAVIASLTVSTTATAVVSVGGGFIKNQLTFHVVSWNDEIWYRDYP